MCIVNLKKVNIQYDFSKDEIEGAFKVLTKYFEKNKKKCCDIVSREYISPEDKANEFMLMYKETKAILFVKKEIIAFKNSITRSYLFITTNWNIREK